MLNYLRKKSTRLRKVASRRRKAIRRFLRRHDLSLTIEVNLLIVKFSLKLSTRAKPPVRRR